MNMGFRVCLKGTVIASLKAKMKNLSTTVFRSNFDI